MNPWRDLRKLSSQVWLVCAADFINRAGTMALVFLVPSLTLDRHWSLGMASLAMSVYGGARIAFGFLTGRLIDRVGAVRVLNVSLVGIALSLGSLPFVASPAPVFVLLGLWGAFAQATGPACMALLAALAPPDQRRVVFALQRLGANLGMSIGPAVGGFLAHVEYDWVFWCNGATALAAAVFGTLRLGEVHRELQSARKPSGLSRSAWSDRRLIYLMLAFLPVLFVFFQTEGTVSLWVIDELELDTRFLGFMFTLNTVLIVFVELSLNMAMAKWSHRASFMLGSACVALGIGGLGFARSAPMLFLAVVLWTFGEMILFPVMSDAVAALAPPERRGEYMGLYSLTCSVGIAVGPALGIQAYGHIGPQLTWLGCFACGLASAVLFARLRRQAVLAI